MNKIWLKFYQPGVPEEIDLNEYSSLVQIFDESIARYQERIAYTCMGTSMTFAELDALSRAFGGFLQKRGLRRGTRVALMMPNILQYPVCLVGILRAGGTVVNFNPLYSPRETEYQLKDSGAEIIVVLENFASTVQAVLSRTAIKQLVVTSIGELLGWKGLFVDFVVRHVKRMVPVWSLPGALSLQAALTEGRQHPMQAGNFGHDDVAFLQYTGGTTGVAKGAILSHGNIVANVLQARAWIKPLIDDHGEIIITPLPLYHIFSLTANCLVFMTLGAKNVLITNPRDLRGFIRELKKHRFTAFTGVNTLFNALLRSPDFTQVDFTALKLTLGGGMAVQKVVADRWKQVTGKPLIEAYGLTETSPAATINPVDLQDYNGSIGLPIPSTELILRDDNGQEVPLGQPGEICIRGPQVMQGYWNRPKETAEVIDPNGWLSTGDIGVMNEQGFVKIVDRKKDMIVVSGFKVFPNEVEEVVAGHDGVLECAAIGVPDAKSGEAVKIYVVKSDPQLTAQELIAYCHAGLTGYKVPKLVEFRAELPKTNVGKILRRALRDEAKDQAAP